VDEVVQWAVHPATISPALAHWNNLDSHVRLDVETTLESLSGVRQINLTTEVMSVSRHLESLSSQHGGKLKRCVYVSTILGAIEPQKSIHKALGSYCY